MFDDTRAEFAWARNALASLLTAQELAAAARSTLNAHYTDAALVQAMWSAAQRLGFDGGATLEPGCGSGHFIGFAPATAHVTGVELEPVTAGIATGLYPQARIIPGSFAATRLPDSSFGLVIGNVPFGNITLHDPRHNRAGHTIHNHFILKSLSLTRPGGLVMVLTSRYTMDARNPAARREIATLADLVGALRLPGGAHQRAAGTGVVTDLLILRRREPGRTPDPTVWEQARLTELDGAQVPVNEYFLNHPEAVLGQLGAVHGAYRADDLTVTPAGDTLQAFTDGLDRITTTARVRNLTWSPPTATAKTPPTPAPASDRPEGYLEAHADGTFTEVADGAAIPFEVPRSQAAELRALLGLRDTAVRLLGLEAASPEDTPDTERLRGELGRRYDNYVRVYGPLNRFALRRTGRTDPATGQPAMARIAPRRAGSAATPTRRWFWRWRSSTRPGSGLPRPPSSPTASWPPAPPAWAPTPPPTRSRSASTPAASPSWARSPVSSAPAKTRPAPSSAPWSSTTPSPGGWSQQPNTCPATSATSSTPPNMPPPKTPASRSTRPRCARSSRATSPRLRSTPVLAPPGSTPPTCSSSSAKPSTTRS